MDLASLTRHQLGTTVHLYWTGIQLFGIAFNWLRDSIHVLHQILVYCNEAAFNALRQMYTLFLSSHRGVIVTPDNFARTIWRDRHFVSFVFQHLVVKNLLGLLYRVRARDYVAIAALNRLLWQDR